MGSYDALSGLGGCYLKFFQCGEALTMPPQFWGAVTSSFLGVERLLRCLLSFEGCYLKFSRCGGLLRCLSSFGAVTSNLSGGGAVTLIPFVIEVVASCFLSGGAVTKFFLIIYLFFRILTGVPVALFLCFL